MKMKNNPGLGLTMSKRVRIAGMTFYRYSAFNECIYLSRFFYWRNQTFGNTYYRPYLLLCIRPIL